MLGTRGQASDGRVSNRLLAAGVLAAIAVGGRRTSRAARSGRRGLGGGLAVVLAPLAVSVARSLLGGRRGRRRDRAARDGGALALGRVLAGAVVALMLGGRQRARRRGGRRARKRELTALLGARAADRAPPPARASRRSPSSAGRSATRRRPRTARSCRSTVVVAGEAARRRVGADGRVAAVRARRARPCAAAPSTPAGRSTCGHAPRGGQRLRRRSSGWCARREPSARRSCAWPTATRRSSCRSRCAVAGGAWALSGDPVRALAVLVVATPCPLILAAPIALVSGMSRAARARHHRQGGGAIERLARARTVLLDKTGTLTLGTAGGRAVVALDGCGATSCCAWPRRSTSSPRTCWPRRSCTTPQARGLVLALPSRWPRPRPGHRGRVDGRAWRSAARRGCASAGMRRRGAGRARRRDGRRRRVLVGVDGRLAGVHR